MSSMRDRLAGRKRPTADCSLLVDDEGAAAASKELAAARAELPMLIISGDEAAIQAGRDRITAAQAAYEACFETITVPAMPPKAFEDLVDEHPPRKGHPDDESWNVDTFPRACFLACAPADLSREEWEAFLDGQVSEGERIRLYNTAIFANTRVPDPSVPKGLTETLS